MSEALRELFVRFLADGKPAEKELNKLDKKTDGVKSALSGLAGVLVGGALISGLKNFAMHTMQMGEEIDDGAQRLGVSTDQFQQFGLIAKLAGTDTEVMAKSLTVLSRNMADGGKEFQALGLSVSNADGSLRSVDDVFDTLADKIAGTQDPAKQIDITFKALGKSGVKLLPVLKGGSKGVADIRAKFKQFGGGLRKEFVEASAKAGDELDLLKFGVTSLSARIVERLIPGFTRAVRHGQGFLAKLFDLNQHTRILTLTMGALGVAAAGTFVKGAASLAQFFGVIPKDTGLLKSLFALGEIGLVIAALAFVAILVEDIYTAVRGGKSVTGELFKQFLGFDEAKQVLGDVKTAVDEIKTAWQQLSTEIDPLLSSFGKSAREAMSTWIPFAVGQLKGLVVLFTDLLRLGSATVGVLAKAVSGDVLGAIGDARNALVARAGNVIADVAAISTGAAGSAAVTNLQENRTAQARLVASPNFIGPRPASAVTQTNNVTITVPGTGDPIATGQAVSTKVGSELAKQLRDTNRGLGG